MYIVYFPPCSWPVASFRMQIHLARDSVALTAEWPNRVPRARPSVQGPKGATPYPAYLLQFIRAAMAAICEAAGKQMLFFHLWNQVFGRHSAFWWPESSQSGSVKGRGQWGGSRLSCTVLYANTATSDHRCEDMLISQSSGMALSHVLTLA